MKCYGCNVELDNSNCSLSFLKVGQNICNKCNDVKAYYRNKDKRLFIISKLGGTCVCCNHNNINHMSIDHIYGGGKVHRDSFCKYSEYIRYLNKLSNEDLKKDFQCLCFNCNYSKGFFGICLHQNNKQNNITIYQKRTLDRLKTKLETIQAYGGKCIGCDESISLFMTLDHINNNGNLEKERGFGFYKYLKSLGYPGKGTQLQLLCHNCNAKKEYTDRRQNGITTVSLNAEMYLKQDYFISKEKEFELEKQAKYLYSLIHTNEKGILKQLEDDNYYDVRRFEILEKLGNKCEVCFNDNINHQSLDEINGCYKNFRDPIPGYTTSLNNINKLSLEKLKQDYRCLCFNCNNSLGNWNICSLDNFKTLIKNTVTKNNIISDLYKIELKFEMINAYGGSCQNCNDINPLHLVLTHLNHNGHLKGQSGNTFYEKLKDLGFPGKGAQMKLMCYNCNGEFQKLNKHKRIDNKNIYIEKQYCLSVEDRNEIKLKSNKLFKIIFPDVDNNQKNP